MRIARLSVIALVLTVAPASRATAQGAPTSDREAAPDVRGELPETISYRAVDSVAAPMVASVATLADGATAVDRQRLISRLTPGLRFCYEEHGLKHDPDLRGTVTMNVVLQGDGRVAGVRVARRRWSGSGWSDVEACARTTIAASRFPAPARAGAMEALTFRFRR